MNDFFKMFGNKEENATDLKNKTLAVKKERCPQNHSCPSVRVCPVEALSQNGYSAPKVDMEKCIKCAKCVRFCPKGALVLEG
jgi:Fe-S-cluster-containing hydrogenase component 2